MAIPLTVIWAVAGSDIRLPDGLAGSSGRRCRASRSVECLRLTSRRFRGQKVVSDPAIGGSRSDPTPRTVGACRADRCSGLKGRQNSALRVRMFPEIYPRSGVERALGWRRPWLGDGRGDKGLRRRVLRRQLDLLNTTVSGRIVVIADPRQCDHTKDDPPYRGPFSGHRSPQRDDGDSATASRVGFFGVAKWLMLLSLVSPSTALRSTREPSHSPE